MNEVTWLKSLDVNGPPCASIDVTRGVMQQVRSHAQDQEDDRVMPVAAAIAVVAGIAALLLAAPMWTISADPFRNFGEVVNLVLR
jgi:hypothetical protein